MRRHQTVARKAVSGQRRRATTARTFAALAEGSASHLQGLDQRAFLDRLERDHDNLRAALEWAVGRPEPELAVGIGVALWRFWQQRGYLNEARTRLETIHAQDWPLDPRTRGRLLEALGGVAYWQADESGQPATERYDQALALWRELGDKREIANALYNAAFSLGITVGVVGPRRRGRGSVVRGAVGRGTGDLPRARRSVARPTSCGHANSHYFSNDPIDRRGRSRGSPSRSSARSVTARWRRGRSICSAVRRPRPATRRRRDGTSRRAADFERLRATRRASP